MNAPAKAVPYMPTKAAVEDWTTPLVVTEPVRRIFGGTIDFDPCGNPFSLVDATREVWLPKWGAVTCSTVDTLGHHGEIIVGDGLEQVWEGNVFVNPPYDARNLSAFMAKAALSAEQRLARSSVILLAPAKTALKGWHANVPSAAAVCFVDGRLTFGGGAGDCAPFASALILWTRDRSLAHRFAAELDGDLGDVMFHR